MTVVHSGGRIVWSLTPRVIRRPEAELSKTKENLGPFIYHDTWRQIIYFDDFHFREFSKHKHSKLPKSQRPEAEVNQDHTSMEKWKQIHFGDRSSVTTLTEIIHFGDFPLGDFQVSHLKLPKSQGPEVSK
jgi:hypothetical protein